MTNETFLINLLRMVASEVHVQNTLIASREMFGRGYFSLGQAEKTAVDQAVLGFVAANYREITPEFLAGQETRQPVGFGIPKSDAPSSTPSGAAAS